MIDSYDVIVRFGAPAFHLHADFDAASGNPWVRRLVSEWQLNWVWTLQSGAPLEFLGTQERIMQSENNPKTVDQYFDVTQFVPLAPFTLRTSSTRTTDLRAPGINKWTSHCRSALTSTSA